MRGRSLLANPLLYAAILALGTWGLVELDVFDRLYELTRAHEDWELDEFLLLVPVSVVCLALYAYGRSRELEKARRELAEVHDRLVEMVRTREEFIVVSCHELKSPLGGIVNALNLMDMAEDEEGRREGLEWAKATAKGMAVLIDGVLEFSSLSRDDSREGKRFSPQELLDSVRDVARLQVEAKELEFVTTVGEDVPLSVVGHEAGLRLAIQNLVGNAVKYTESGTVSVDLSFVREGSRSMLVARVADTGRGIEEQALDTVFEPFRRAEAAEGPGIGLGLAIVWHLVERMGGTVDLSSTVGQGSEFLLRVPVRPA